MKWNDWRSWRYRKYELSHSRDGFAIDVEDEHVFEPVGFWLTDRALDVLGHPCCGKGPLAHVHLRFGLLRRLGFENAGSYVEDGKREWYPANEDWLDTFWFTFMNLPCKFHTFLWSKDQHVLEVPLTDEQAAVLRPLEDWSWTWDEGDEYKCCVTAAMHCNDEDDVANGEPNDVDGETSTWHSYGCRRFEGFSRVNHHRSFSDPLPPGTSIVNTK